MTRSSDNWDQFSQAYDLPSYEAQPNVYIIASLPRSGSHFLGHLLANSGELGSPLEYLHPNHLRKWREVLGASTSADALRELFRRRTSPSGWFGLKAHWNHFADALVDTSIADLLRPRQYIFIRRSDQLGQAISLVLARQTGAWISFHGRRSEPVYSFEAITTARQEIEAQDRSWADYFLRTKTEPLTVRYEDLVDDPAAILQKVSDALGVRVTPGKRTLAMPKVQATQINKEWRVRFMADASRLGIS